MPNDNYTTVEPTEQTAQGNDITGIHRDQSVSRKRRGGSSPPSGSIEQDNRRNRIKLQNRFDVLSSSDEDENTPTVNIIDNSPVVNFPDEELQSSRAGDDQQMLDSPPITPGQCHHPSEDEDARDTFSDAQDLGISISPGPTDDITDSQVIESFTTQEYAALGPLVILASLLIHNGDMSNETIDLIDTLMTHNRLMPSAPPTCQSQPLLMRSVHFS